MTDKNTRTVSSEKARLRDEKLKAALKANLQRRKAQARARKSAETKEADE